MGLLRVFEREADTEAERRAYRRAIDATIELQRAHETITGCSGEDCRCGIYIGDLSDCAHGGTGGIVPCLPGVKVRLEVEA